MKKLLKWIGRFFASLFTLIFFLFLITGIWLILQPKLPKDAQKISDEYLHSEVYRELADSSLMLVQRLSKEMELPSISLAISQNNEVVWAIVLGYADVDNKRLSTVDTRYRSGSISKSMTGLLAAKLVELGQLDLDVPIRSLVPAFPRKIWEPSLRQLAAHTGGIRHYGKPGHLSFFQEQFSRKHYHSVEESLEIFSEDSLLFEPGTSFNYSTHGFTLFSAALEKASQQIYLELIEQYLWQPANMQNTRADDLSIADPNRIRPYTKIAGHYLDFEGPDPSYKWAGGGILSTPSDLVKMGGAFMSAQILTKGPGDPVFHPLPLTDGSPNKENYAMGWKNEMINDLLQSEEDVWTMNHGGSSPGGSSFLLILPNDTLAVAAMTNLTVLNSWPMKEMVYKIAAKFRAHQQAYLTKKDENSQVPNGI
ncbi:MAG: serine hydrolase domain-containing protein [Bacteroidota bacterium]